MLMSVVLQIGFAGSGSVHITCTLVALEVGAWRGVVGVVGEHDGKRVSGIAFYEEVDVGYLEDLKGYRQPLV